VCYCIANQFYFYIVVPVDVMRAHREKSGITLLILNFGTSWRSDVNFTSGSFTSSGGENKYSFNMRLFWRQSRFGHFGEAVSWMFSWIFSLHLRRCLTSVFFSLNFAIKICIHLFPLLPATCSAVLVVLNFHVNA